MKYIKYSIANAKIDLKRYSRDRPCRSPNGTCRVEFCCKSSLWGHRVSCTYKKLKLIYNQDLRNNLSSQLARILETYQATEIRGSR